MGKTSAPAAAMCLSPCRPSERLKLPKPGSRNASNMFVLYDNNKIISFIHEGENESLQFPHNRKAEVSSKCKILKQMFKTTFKTTFAGPDWTME